MEAPYRPQLRTDIMSTEPITLEPDLDEIRREHHDLCRDLHNTRTQLRLARRERAQALQDLQTAKQTMVSEMYHDDLTADLHKNIADMKRERDEARHDLKLANEAATLYLDTFRSESAKNRELQAQVRNLDRLLNPKG